MENIFGSINKSERHNFSGGFQNNYNKELNNKDIHKTTLSEKSFKEHQTINMNNGSEEVREMMNLMEDLRMKEPNKFGIVISATKDILDLVSNNKINSKKDIEILDNLIRKIEDINPHFVYYIAHKSIKIAAIQYKNIHILHYFIIKKRYSLTNKDIYSNFLNEYIKSLKGIDFINEKQNIIFLYVSILQMLIEKGYCDPNDTKNDILHNTPLHYAIAYRHLQFVIVLINEKNVNLNLINLNGATALDFAVEDYSIGKDREINEQFIKLLTMKGAKTNQFTDLFNYYFTQE